MGLLRSSQTRERCPAPAKARSAPGDRLSVLPGECCGVVVELPRERKKRAARDAMMFAVWLACSALSRVVDLRRMTDSSLSEGRRRIMAARIERRLLMRPALLLRHHALTVYLRELRASVPSAASATRAEARQGTIDIFLPKAVARLAENREPFGEPPE